MTEEKEIFEQLHPVKPGHPNFEIRLVDKYLRPVSREESRAYWLKKIEEEFGE